MSEVAALELRVTSDGVVTADKRLKGLAESGGKAERATDNLVASFKKMAAPLAAFVSAGYALNKVIAETKAYDGLIARLHGVTGSAEGARAAFEKLDDISNSTIYSENEMTEAFLRLQQTGLDPSERSLRAFANIASATGKSLDQLTELTLSASMGVFRGLKDLGIKAVAEGDKVKMTFRGVTTEIGNSAEAIQGYLVSIGETDYAGAAAAQLDTMGGSVKKIEDAWADLFREIGRSPVGEFIQTSMQIGADAINVATHAVEALFFAVQREMPKIDAARRKMLNEFIAANATKDNEDYEGPRQRELNALRAAGLNITKEQIELAKKADRAELPLERQGPSDADAQQTKLEKIFADIDGVVNKSNHRLQKYIEDRQHIMDMSVRPGFEFDSRQALADLDAAYAKESGGAGGKAQSDGYEPRVTPMFDIDFAQRAKDAEAELQALIERERKLEEADRREAEARRRAEADRKRMREALTEGLLSEDEELRAAYARRLEDLDAALAAEAITEEKYDDLKLQRIEELNRKRRDLDARYAQDSATNASLVFGHMADLIKNAGGETSAAYKHLFAAQKAFAVASGTINMFRSISEASAQPFPANIPLALKAAAEGAALLSQISGTNYSGAYDKGGSIPAGKWGIAGEYGPEIVRGPAQVTSRADTGKLLGSGNSGVNIRIVNAPDQAAAERFLASPQGEKVLVNFVKRNATTIRSLVG